MSPEKQRIAIAKACGWKSPTLPEVAALQEGWSTSGQHWLSPAGVLRPSHHMPDYLADLNACHEMENVLTHDQRIDYMEWLGLSSDDYWYKVWAYVHATSAERCTAFIRTLGLWEKEANTTKSASPTSPAIEQADHETAEEKVAWLKILLCTKSCDPVFTDYWLRLARRNLRMGLPLKTEEPDLNPTQPQ
jgi:hypothetical protein